MLVTSVFSLVVFLSETAETLNFIGVGNTFIVNGSTIDVSISSGSISDGHTN